MGGKHSLAGMQGKLFRLEMLLPEGSWAVLMHSIFTFT